MDDFPAWSDRTTVNTGHFLYERLNPDSASTRSPAWIFSLFSARRAVR